MVLRLSESTGKVSLSSLLFYGRCCRSWILVPFAPRQGRKEMDVYYWYVDGGSVAPMLPEVYLFKCDRFCYKCHLKICTQAVTPCQNSCKLQAILPVRNSLLRAKDVFRFVVVLKRELNQIFLVIWSGDPLENSFGSVPSKFERQRLAEVLSGIFWATLSFRWLDGIFATIGFS